MASGLMWLDFSAEEQRHAREIVQLFSVREARDELGIGTVRDAISDTLFPGVSVIHTRARYFVFIPRLFVAGARKNRVGPALERWVDQQERALIELLRNGGDISGLIGVEAGKNVKVLPSRIYWNALQRFGILSTDGSIEQVAAAQRRAERDDGVDEMAGHAASIWHDNLPDPDDRFPNGGAYNFDLTFEEAEWLAERIASNTDGSLLAHLVRTRFRPGQAVGDDAVDISTGPWEEPELAALPEPLASHVFHAGCFSRVMWGAALTYNVCLLRKAIEMGFEIRGPELDDFEALLDEWADTLRAHRGEFEVWNRHEFWAMTRAQNPRISPHTRAFVDGWIDLALDGSSVRPSQRDDMARMVAARERQQKRSLSRLDNDRLLKRWNGAAGVAPLSFRWPQVKRMLTDIANGRDAHAGA